MPIYKKRVAKTGRVSFFKDGKHIARPLVPVELLDIEANVDTYVPDQEEVDATLVETEVDTEYDGPLSYLSGQPASRRKYLNQKQYWLTEKEYRTLNLGKLSAAIREKDAAETVAK